MNDIERTMSLAASGMAAQTARMRIATENLANADTPGYHRKIVPFEQVLDPETGTKRVATGQMYLDKAEPQKHYDPSHPMADGSGYYTSSNVNMLVEISDSREAQRSYEANLRMFDQARRMSRSLLELLRG